MVALFQCGHRLGALFAIAPRHQLQVVVSGIVQEYDFRQENVAGIEQCLIGIEYIECDVLYRFTAETSTVGIKSLYLQGKSGSAGSRTIAKVVLDATCRHKCHKEQNRQYVQAIMEFVILHGLFLVDG